MKKVTIAGYYGFKNVGDEAVLQSMIDDFRATDYEINFTVLSQNPEETSHRYNVNSVQWDDFPAVVEVVKNSDLLIVGGGGLYNVYQEYDPDKLLVGGHQLFSVFIIGLPILAHLLDTKCMIFGVGASIIQSEEAKKHIKLSIDLAEETTVRDSGSKDIFMALGCSSNDITVTADPAFRLKNADQDKVKSVLRAENITISDSPILGVVVRNWDYYGDRSATEEAIYEALKYFIEEKNYAVLFIPFDDGRSVGDLSHDSEIINRLIIRLGKHDNVYSIRGFYSSDIFSELIGLCDLTLCMRLHSVIFSLKNYVPCVGLVYDPKVKNILSEAGLENLAIDIKDITWQSIKEKMDDISANKEQYVNKIKDKVQSLKYKGLNNINSAIAIMKGRTKTRQTTEENYNYIKKLSLRFMMNTNELQNVLDKFTIYKLKNKYFITRLVDCGNFQTAKDLIELLLSVDDKDAELNYYMAYCSQSLGDSERVLHYYERALHYGFDRFWVYYNRGTHYLNIGDIDSALIDLNAAKALSPDHDGVNLVLSRILNANP